MLQALRQKANDSKRPVTTFCLFDTIPRVKGSDMTSVMESQVSVDFYFLRVQGQLLNIFCRESSGPCSVDLDAVDLHAVLVV